MLKIDRRKAVIRGVLKSGEVIGKHSFAAAGLRKTAFLWAR
jgi:hypothetical protein